MTPWQIPAVLGALSTLALAVGVALALNGRFGVPMAMMSAPIASPAKADDHRDGYRIVALGDSITAGIGDARAGGYVSRLARMLRSRGQRVAVTNLAVPGAETADVLSRTTETRVRAQIADANLIVLSASGNDFSHTLRPAQGRELGDPDRALAEVRKNLKALLASLRSLNPRAPIRMIELYNPFDVLPDEEINARVQLHAWNDVIEEASFAQRFVLAIPVADLFEGRPDRLATDHYHPGPRGQELIARRVLDTLPEGDQGPSDD